MRARTPRKTDSTHTQKRTQKRTQHTLKNTRARALSQKHARVRASTVSSLPSRVFPLRVFSLFTSFSLPSLYPTSLLPLHPSLPPGDLLAEAKAVLLRIRNSDEAEKELQAMIESQLKDNLVTGSTVSKVTPVSSQWPSLIRERSGCTAMSCRHCRVTGRGPQVAVIRAKSETYTFPWTDRQMDGPSDRLTNG